MSWRGNGICGVKFPVEYASVVHFLCGPIFHTSSLNPSSVASHSSPSSCSYTFSVDSLLHLTLPLSGCCFSFFFLVSGKEKHRKRFIDFRFSLAALCETMAFSCCTAAAPATATTTTTMGSSNSDSNNNNGTIHYVLSRPIELKCNFNFFPDIFRHRRPP